MYDPWVDPKEAQREYGISTINTLPNGHYDAIILAVAHDQIRALGGDGIRALGKSQCVVFDVKNTLPKNSVSARL